MPTPPTTDLPKPKSWEEFEDICADLLKRIWLDPLVTRNGRSGQQQHGVDIFGQPKSRDDATESSFAAAQCKKTDTITASVIDEEVQKATGFKPRPSEFIIMTTAPRDARVQEHVRTKTWPFPVRVLFWEDICLEFCGHDDLLQKHFPKWMKSTTSEDKVREALMSSVPEDFRYDDSTGEFFHKGDVRLRIVLERGELPDDEFYQPWVEKFPDKTAFRQPLFVYYGETRILTVHCVWVDGARHLIPYPKSSTDLEISAFEYHLGKIVNGGMAGYDFNIGLRRAGIQVEGSNTKHDAH